MKKIVWHKGKPPSIGWWPASSAKQREILRWWDGKNWSVSAPSNLDAKTAAKQAKVKVFVGAEFIQWSKRWWL